MNGEGIGIESVLLIAGGIVVIMVFYVMIWASRYVKVPPNQALIVTGKARRMGNRTVGFRIVTGGATFVLPVLEKAELLSLAPFPVNVLTKVARAAAGTIRVTAEAQVKIKGEEEAIASAAEHFLSKSPEEIGTMCGAILERHLHAAASGAAFERQAIETAVAKNAAHDLAPMGLAILNLSVKEIPDVDGAK